MLVIVGHVSIDKVRNVHGERTQLGGAALYAAMGARVLTNDVRIVSAVGRDFESLNEVLTFFPNSLLKRTSLPATKFKISYDEKFRATYVSVDLGAGRIIKVADLPKNWLSSGTIFHLCPMMPTKIRKFVAEIKSVSPKSWVSISANLGYLGSGSNRRILLDLAQKVDLFVVNDQEAVVLTEAGNIANAVRKIRGKRVAITLGELGAIISEDGNVQMIPALGGLTVVPRDTTGAGDTWSGTLVAAYSMTGNWTKSVVSACIVSAVKCLGWNYEKIKHLTDKEPDELVDLVLRMRENRGQMSLSEFLPKHRQ